MVGNISHLALTLLVNLVAVHPATAPRELVNLYAIHIHRIHGWLAIIVRHFGDYAVNRALPGRFFRKVENDLNSILFVIQLQNGLFFLRHNWEVVEVPGNW